MADEHFYGVPAAQQAYQPLGDLLPSFDGLDRVEDYRRELDMETGVAKVSYRAGGTVFTREVFISYPDRVMVVRITGDQPGRISLSARLTSPYLDSVTATPGQLVMDGCWKGPMGTNWLIAPVEGKGLRFQTVLVARNDGGRAEAADNQLRVSGANSVTFLLTAATSFVKCQPVRRHFRSHGRDHRGAASESRGRTQPVAGVARWLARRFGYGLARARRFRGEPRVEERETGVGRNQPPRRGPLPGAQRDQDRGFDAKARRPRPPGRRPRGPKPMMPSGKDYDFTTRGRVEVDC